MDAVTTLAWAQVSDRLGRGATVLTANKRLARILLERYADERRDNAETVWPRVDILPWQAWCRRELEAPLALPTPRLLEDAQSERLWQQVIAAAPAELAGEGIHPLPGQCAGPAAEAWALLQDYGLDETDLLAQPDLEARIVGQWMQAYRARLADLQAIDSAQWAEWLRCAYDNGARQPADDLIVAGFHELPPALRRLLEQRQHAGYPVAALERPRCGAEPRVVSAADAEAEVRAAAVWARAQLVANPAVRLAVVVLDLNQRRTMIERLFSEVLHPVAALSPVLSGERPFNISLGWPLAEEPIVHDALLALRWAFESLDFSAVSRLLRSPFVAVHEARQAALELRLRDLNLTRVSLEQALFQAGGQRPTPWRDADFAARWRTFRNQLRQAPTRGDPLAWAERIAAALAQLGWGQSATATAGAACGRPLSSREFQAVNAFQECLEQLAGLHQVSAQLGPGQALAELEQLAAQQIFQPQQVSAPVLITEPLQILGTAFDGLWLMGASDDLWPEAPRPNPLLPHALQRQYAMPHATAAGELHYAQTITRWLLDSANTVVCSWPRQSGDKSLRPSPLLPTDGDVGMDAESWLVSQSLTTADCLRNELEALAQGHCEQYRDDWAPPLTQRRVVGGAGVLQAQSACPFQALALHRWRLRPAQIVSAGLNALQRGNLLHRALQAVYEYSEGELPPTDQWSLCVTQAVEETLSAGAKEIPQLADSRLRHSEEQRLRQTLTDWLKIDAQRPARFRVVAQESEREYELGSLIFRLRVDRFDRLEDGSGVIIDYKSGGPHRTAAWFDARPREPQLPLYALALAQEEEVAAVTFANLKPGHRGYRGLGSDGGFIPGVKLPTADRYAPVAHWAGLIDYWRDVLQPLAEQYAAGYAAVDPRDREVCRRCSFSPLCRIQDVRPGMDNEVDGHADESASGYASGSGRGRDRRGGEAPSVDGGGQ